MLETRLALESQLIILGGIKASTIPFMSTPTTAIQPIAQLTIPSVLVALKAYYIFTTILANTRSNPSKMDRYSSSTERQHLMAERITARRWIHSYRLGMSARAAAEDTLVFLSLFGYEFFEISANLLWSRNLIRSNMDVIYGGWLLVGLVPLSNPLRSGRVFEQEIGAIDPRYKLRVDPTLVAASGDTLAFMTEIRDMIPGFERPRTEYLPRAELGSILKYEDDSCCAICREEVEMDSEVVVLRCGHWFCVECIDAWLRDLNDTCPSCRGKVDGFSGPQLPFYYDGDDEYDYDADDEKGL